MEEISAAACHPEKAVVCSTEEFLQAACSHIRDETADRHFMSGCYRASIQGLSAEITLLRTSRIISSGSKIFTEGRLLFGAVCGTAPTLQCKDYADDKGYINSGQ